MVNYRNLIDLQKGNVMKQKIFFLIFILNATLSSPTSLVFNLQTIYAEEAVSDNVQSKSGVFGEIEYVPSDLPASSLDPSISEEDLKEEINKYYNEEFDEEEKNANHDPFSEEELVEFQKDIEQSKLLNGMDVLVDQVSTNLSEDTHYVLRINLILEDEEQLSNFFQESILELVTEILARVGGNRLILVNAYLTETDQLIPLHFANASHSLFYNKLISNY